MIEKAKQNNNPPNIYRPLILGRKIPLRSGILRRIRGDKNGCVINHSAIDNVHNNRVWITMAVSLHYYLNERGACTTLSSGFDYFRISSVTNPLECQWTR